MRNLREIILTLAKEYNSRVVQYRRDIHMNPELSFKEEQTSKYIQSILANEGIKIIPINKQHSFIVVIEGNGEGKTIGIRAELDALPIQERANVDFSSKNDGVMHACGHDIHMASAIGVALIMNKIKERWSGRVVLVFESGEEQLPGGAMAVLDSAEFKSVMPDIMFGLHVLPEMEVGMVGFCAGRYMASGDEVYLTVKGKGGHAALPHTLIDPVVIASNIILNLQTIVSRSAPALVPTVLSFGKVEANGATNVIPNEVRIEGTFRTMDEGWRDKAHSLIETKANGIAQSMGGSCNVEIRKGYPSVYNNPALTGNAKKLANDLLGFDKVVDLEPRMTTDDFAYFSQQIPSVFFRIGVGTLNQEPSQLHSSSFIANEDSLQTAIPLMTWLVLNNLK
ncbi:MAG TPA: M20 family metallopeptidase [Tenuifilaceae bacterium]|nr:M20 family metallopeptidase [Tenuifilaceae bacterium]HPI44692.1 M20 family metallopeptidase [Tenuifilaceae bacterium]HPN21557.1 M20 family metallopeptidase [Tenuifilaceae bacterium]